MDTNIFRNLTDTKVFLFLFSYCFTVSALAYPRAFITNQDDNTVSVVDTLSEQIIKTIKVGKSPAGVAIDQTRQRVYISNVEGHSISVIDANQLVVVNEIDLKNITPLGIIASNEALLVADWGGQKLLVLDIFSYEVVGVIVTPPSPALMTLSSDQQYLYVSQRDSNAISVINLKTRKIIGNISVGKHPFGIKLNKKNNKLYVVNVYSNNVSVIDVQQYKVIETIPVGEHPYCITIDEDSDKAYVTNTAEDSISVLDLRQNKVTNTILIRGYPEGIDFDSITKKIVVSSWADNGITIMGKMPLNSETFLSTGKNSRALGEFIFFSKHPEKTAH